MKFDSAKVENLVKIIQETRKEGGLSVEITWLLSELLKCIDMSDKAEISVFFEKIWKEYPNKRGKSGVSTKAKKELLKAGYDQVVKAIRNYEAAKPDWANWLDGSTFFNGRWKDYINPEQTAAPQKKKAPVNYGQRQYTDEFLNSLGGLRDED